MTKISEVTLDVTKPPLDEKGSFELRKWREVITKRPKVFDDDQPNVIWTPEYSYTTGMTWTTGTVYHAEFSVMGDLCWINHRVSGTTGGIPGYAFYVTLPIPAKTVTTMLIGGIQDASSHLYGACAFVYNTEKLVIRNLNRTAFAPGSIYFEVTGWYRWR